MADGTSLGSDGLSVPFLFVPHGEEPSPAWLAAHPGWVKFPARFVPRGAAPTVRRNGTARDDGAAPPHTAFDAGFGSGKAAIIAGRFDNDLEGVADRQGNPSPGTNAPPGRANPASTILQTAPVRVTGHDLASGASVQSSGGDGSRISAASFQPAQNTDLQFAAARPAAPMRAAPTAGVKSKGRPAGRPPNPNDPMPLLDDQDRAIIGASGEPVSFPASLDPHVFVEQGIKDKRRLRQMSVFGIPGEAAASAYVLSEPAKFGQGQAWDAQAVHHEFDKTYVDYATIARGLYADALGLHTHEIPCLEDAYVWYRETPYKGRTMDRQFTHLRVENVNDTKIGYELLEQSLILPDIK